MKNKIKVLFHLIVFFIFLFIPSRLVFAGGNDKADALLRLPKQVKRALSAEMNAVQHGMTNLAVAVPAGNWEGIASTAGSLKDGYIMKSKLSREQMEDFLQSLPDGYAELDSEFRKAAEGLVEATAEQNVERALSFYNKLNRTCVECHLRYAVKRFPGFK